MACRRNGRRFEPHNRALQLGEISQQKLIETVAEIERVIATPRRPGRYKAER
jgi:hypothetical protein